MINCAHPTHFLDELQESKHESWVKRIKGLRANASCKSHAELDEATELDRGTPKELAKEYKKLKDSFPHLNVFGGCCGTDEEHIVEIVQQMR
jgi:S-methylmethionine-dependent homocysteine/selenocysteine methylase